MTLPKMLFVTLLIALSSSAFANTNSGTSITFTGENIQSMGGTFTTTSSGLQLSGATLTQVSGPGFGGSINVSGDPTAFDFSLGIPSFGSTASRNATWASAPGSVFTFSDTGATPITFNGSFTCPCSMTPIGSGSFLFLGFFTGTLTANHNTIHVDGVATQLSVATVPEVGTLSMVGMGLLAMAGFAKRNFSALTS